MARTAELKHPPPTNRGGGIVVVVEQELVVGGLSIAAPFGYIVKGVLLKLSLLKSVKLSHNLKISAKRRGNLSLQPIVTLSHCSNVVPQESRKLS